MSEEIGNHDNADKVQRPASCQKKQSSFTIERRESSFSVASSQAENGHYYLVFLLVVKWFAAVLLFLLMLCCVVASKICLLVLGQHFKNLNLTERSSNDGTSTEIKKQALFLMLILALMIPEGVSFIYASWTSLRRRSRPWPTKKGFITVSLVTKSLAKTYEFLKVLIAITFYWTQLSQFLPFVSSQKIMQNYSA